MQTGNAVVSEYPFPILICLLSQRRRLLPVPPPTGLLLPPPQALLPSLRDEGATGTSRDPQACSLCGWAWGLSPPCPAGLGTDQGPGHGVWTSRQVF